MIRAKVTIYDDETGFVYDKDKIIQGRLKFNDTSTKEGFVIETYDFHFDFQRLHECEGIK